MEGEGNGVDLWAVGCRVLAAAMFLMVCDEVTFL
jgi:hypothetical protein